MKLALLLVILGGFLCAVALAAPADGTLPENQAEVAAREILDEEADATSDEEHVRQTRGSFIKSIISSIVNLKLYLAQRAWSTAKSLFG